MELRKQATWSGVQAEVLYWRTASGQEVDLVLEDRAGRIAGIEIKAAATLSGSDVRVCKPWQPPWEELAARGGAVRG